MNESLQQAQDELFQRRATVERPQTAADIAVKMANGREATEPLPPPAPVEIIPGEPTRLDALDTSWHPMVAESVRAARSWQKRRQFLAYEDKPVNASLVLVAGQVQRGHAIKELGDEATEEQIGKYVLSRTGYGCGKTHVALACLWSICYMADGLPVSPAGYFFTANELVQKMDSETVLTDEIGLYPDWQVNGELEMKPPPILVIDDVGTEQEIPFIAKDRQEYERWARYYKVINYCYERPGVSVIVTANMTLDQLSQRIGGRAWSRLLEMAPAGYMLDLTGVPDYRRKVGGR